MIPVLVGIVAIVAGLAWIVYVVSIVRVIAFVPRGKRFSAIFSSGMWQFEKVRQLGGPQVDVHLRRIAYAFAVFFFAIVAGMMLGIVATATSRQNTTVSVVPVPIDTTSAVLES